MFSAGSSKSSTVGQLSTGSSRQATIRTRESMARLARPRQGQSPGTINTIAVPSLDQSIKKIEERGGKICVPKMEIPGVGWLAYAEDPAGNVFGVIEPHPKAK